MVPKKKRHVFSTFLVDLKKMRDVNSSYTFYCSGITPNFYLDEMYKVVAGVQNAKTCNYFLVSRIVIKICTKSEIKFKFFFVIKTYVPTPNNIFLHFFQLQPGIIISKLACFSLITAFVFFTQSRAPHYASADRKHIYIPIFVV